MKNQAMLRTMLTMALADGGISREELRLLTRRALQWEFTDADFEALLDEEPEQGASTILPEAPEERRELLKQLVLMMAADGKLADGEKKLFAILAANMRISDPELHDIIDAAMREKP